jgi:hypothetical protein
MDDKDVSITVDSSGITVDPDPVHLKKGLQQAKWNCANTQVTSLSVALKDGSYTVPCTQKHDGTWECKSKKFDVEGTYAYEVTAVLGTDRKHLDPDIIVDP